MIHSALIVFSVLCIVFIAAFQKWSRRRRVMKIAEMLPSDCKHAIRKLHDAGYDSTVFDHYDLSDSAKQALRKIIGN